MNQNTAPAREIYKLAYGYVRNMAQAYPTSYEYYHAALMLWNCERNNASAVAAAYHSYELKAAQS